MGWLADVWKHGLTPTQRALSRVVERYAAAVAAYERELATLPAAAAREHAGHVLAASPFVRGLAWAGAPAPLLAAGLTAGQLEFFRQFRRVEAAPTGEPYVDAQELAPYEWEPAYLRVGQDSEHAHLAVRPGDEVLYVVADDEPPERAPSQSFPTLYHWVLWLHRRGELMGESGVPTA